MYELLGPHVNQTYGGIPEMVAQWKPPVALVMDHSPAWHWVKEQSPKTKMVGRWYHGEPPDFENIDPVQHARDQLAGILRAVADSPYDYIVGDNEPVVHSKKAMRNLALYDIERMKILKTVGKKAAIFGLAAGNPPDMSTLSEYIPALEAAVKYGAVVHMHEYDWPYIGANDKWLPYRHELFYEGCPEHGWPGVPKELRVPIIVTEFGLDMGVKKNGRRIGWRGAGIDWNEYDRQLRNGSLRLMKSPYVLGACIFCTGNASDKWVMFDYWPEVKPLAHSATPIYREYKVEDADTEEILGIDVSYWQPKNFPFGKAKRVDNIRFGIARASSSHGQDAKFPSHYKRMLNNEYRVGLYHYLYPGSVLDQANYFADICLDHPADLIVYPDGVVGGYFLDVEQVGLTASMVRAFRDEFEEKSGLRMDYYTSKYKWWNLVGKSSWREYGDISWVADWRNVERFAVPTGFRRNGVLIRQITSDNKHVSSYSGRLDINKWVGPAGSF